MIFLANSFDNMQGMFASRRSPLCRETVFGSPESIETLRCQSVVGLCRWPWQKPRELKRIVDGERNMFVCNKDGIRT